MLSIWGASKVQTTIRIPPKLNNRIKRIVSAYREAAVRNVPALAPPTQTWCFEKIFEAGLRVLEKELGLGVEHHTFRAQQA